NPSDVGDAARALIPFGAADLVADHAVDALGELFDLAGFAALGDGFRVRDPGTGFVDKGVFLLIFQDDERFSVHRGRLAPDEFGRPAQAARIGGSRGSRSRSAVVIVTLAIPGHLCCSFGQKGKLRSWWTPELSRIVDLSLTY